MTNRRISTIEQIQNQQVQVQNILIEQMKNANQIAPRWTRDEISPRAEAPVPSLPHSRQSSHIGIKQVPDVQPKSMFDVPSFEGLPGLNTGKSGTTTQIKQARYVNFSIYHSKNIFGRNCIFSRRMYTNLCNRK